MSGWADIAELAANPSDGGYEVRYADGGSLWVSDEGMREMIERRQLLERLAPQLDLARLARPMCDHGVSLMDEGFEWSVNDYAEECVPWRIVMLTGWHEPYGFCMPIDAAVIGSTLAVSVVGWDGGAS